MLWALLEGEGVCKASLIRTEVEHVKRGTLEAIGGLVNTGATERRRYIEWTLDTYSAGHY